MQRAIEEYLGAHPNAADSVDGVACWWVAAHGFHATGEQVRRALSDLVAAGVVRRVTLADGTVLYSKGR